MQGITTINESDFQQWGFDFSTYMGPSSTKVVLGGGYHNLSWTRNDLAEVRRGDLVLSSNSYSELDRRHANVIRAYMGLDFGLGKSKEFRLEGDIGLDGVLGSETSEVTPFFALRGTIELLNSYKK